MRSTTLPPARLPPSPDIFDDDDGEGWQDMPVVREDHFLSGLDEEDRMKYHYVHKPRRSSASAPGAGNATGDVLDVDARGTEWRSKTHIDENEYTKLRGNEEDEADEVHLRTRYLFDEDKAMTPLSQMQATKNLLTEAQRIAYVGLCALAAREMAQGLKLTLRKELKGAAQSMELWVMKILGRLYYHMELETQEQKMIESLAIHGVQAMDLVPALMTTHTVANPEYDPAEARRRDDARQEEALHSTDKTSIENPDPAPSTKVANGVVPSSQQQIVQTTARVFAEPVQPAMPGITTSLSAADERVTLDIRWTVLCDLFLVLIADSVYDARSRVLLETVALKLGLGWLDIVKFECRVTEALEIQEGVERLESEDAIASRQKAARNKRFMMMGLATLGGGLVLGLSAGLLAPVIGAGLGAAFTTIGISGTSGFLAGAGGAAVITTGGVLTGSGIAGHGMARRTQQVKTFELLPLHNNKRVNCILTVPGLMTGLQDDVRLPFSVLDPIVGDVFSVLWEPEMLRETGSALKILTAEVLSQIGQTVLAQTVMTALMSALQWPIILTKLGYLIDNPWNNALDRAKAAGGILADVLIKRHLGVRPTTLIGFSLGARVIFYALLELARHKAYGIVQDVFLLGATLTASNKTWCEARSVVSGRFVNAFARNDWVLNYLFRATSASLNTVAGLRPVENVPGLENIDVTDKISGHMTYRVFMPLILDQLGFPVSADYFDEPVEPDFTEDRVIVREEEGEQPKKKGWFSLGRKKSTPPKADDKGSRAPAAGQHRRTQATANVPNPAAADDDDLPPRYEATSQASLSVSPVQDAVSPAKAETAGDGVSQGEDSEEPAGAGFDLAAMKKAIQDADRTEDELRTRARPALDTDGPSSAPSVDHASLGRVSSTPAGVHEDERVMGVRPSHPRAVSLNVTLDERERRHEAASRNLGWGARVVHPRSVSLNVAPDSASAHDDEEDEDEDEEGAETFHSFVSSVAAEGPLSFGSDGAHWPSPGLRVSDAISITPGMPSPSPFIAAAAAAAPLPPVPDVDDTLLNPFAAFVSRPSLLPLPLPSMPLSSPTLSFGNTEGAITAGLAATVPATPGGFGKDPWSVAGVGVSAGVSSDAGANAGIVGLMEDTRESTRGRTMTNGLMSGSNPWA